MSKFICYNMQIFQTWLVFIVFRKPISKEAIKIVEENYKSNAREKRLFNRIKRINKIKGGDNE